MVFADGYNSKSRESQTFEEFEERFLAHAEWVEEYSFAFHTCSQTGKIIWPFSKAYKGTASWHGPGTPAVEERWISGPTFTYLRLTGKV